LEKEIDINEYDVITGMNLLHFTCKYGAKQIGHENEAIKVMNLLIEKGREDLLLERLKFYWWII
jgi:hypothetical protein